MIDSKPVPTKSAADELARALKLLGKFTRATHLLAQLEARANNRLVTVAERNAPRFATLQATVKETEAEILALAAKHPEWFPAHDRTVSTLLGSIQAKKVTNLAGADDDTQLIASIERFVMNPTAPVELARELSTTIRTVRTVSREALNALSDEALAAINVTRVTTDSITVKAAQVKLGNAVKKVSKKQKKTTEGEVPA